MVTERILRSRREAAHVLRLFQEGTPSYDGRNIERDLSGKARTPFRYRDYGNMATIGRASAVADFGWLRLKGWFAWLAWLFVHIMNLIGFRNRLVVFVQLAWAYFSYQRAVRLITGSPERDKPTS